MKNTEEKWLRVKYGHEYINYCKKQIHVLFFSKKIIERNFNFFEIAFMTKNCFFL